MDNATKKKPVDLEGMQSYARVLHNKGIGNEGVCNTDADTVAKEVTLGTTFELVAGATIIVMFTNGISVASPTLAVTHTDLEGNTTNEDAKPILYKGEALKEGVVEAGMLVMMRYNGTAWNVVGALGGVSSATDLYDSTLGKTQSEINQQLLEANQSLLEKLETIAGATFGKIVVNLETLVNDVKTSGADLAGVTVTLLNTTDGTEVGSVVLGAGESSVTFEMLEVGKDYAVGLTDISGYTTPSIAAITSLSKGATITRTGQYSADEYTASITSNQGSNDSGISAARITVNGIQLNDGDTIRVPSGTTITPTATDITGYAKDLSTSGKTITAAYSTTYVNLNMVKLDNGVESTFPEGATGTVKYSGGADQTLSDNTSTAKVPTGTAFTVEYATVDGYATPASYSGTASGTSMTADKAQYASGVLNVSVINSDTDDTDLAKVKAYITIGSGTEEEMEGTVSGHTKTFSKAVVPGTSYTVRFGTVEGYDTPASITGTKAEGVENKTASYTCKVYSVAISDNQDGTDIASAKLTYAGKEYANGSSIKVPTGTTIAVANLSATDVAGYKKTISVSGTAISVLYQTEVVIVSVGTDQSGVSADGQAITINGTGYTVADGQVKAKVPFDTSYSVSANAKANVGDDEYETPAAITGLTASSASRALTMTYTKVVGTEYKLVVTHNTGSLNNNTPRVTVKYVLGGKTVTLGTSYKNGDSFRIPNGATNISVVGNSYDASHYTPQAATLNSNTNTYTVSYNTMALTVSTNNVGTITLYVNNSSVWSGSSSTTYYVPWGKSWLIEAESVSGYIPPSSASGTANSASETAYMEYGELSADVKAYYADGSLRDYDSADNNAIGVYINGLVMDKYKSASMKYGGYNKDLSGIGVLVTDSGSSAAGDFDGAGNTTALINALKGYTDNYSTVGCPPAEYCREKGDNWYLPAAGELKVFGDNYESVNYMLELIGGDDFYGWYWSSTLYNASTSSWIMGYDGYMSTYDRYYNYIVRAFCAL